MSHPENIGAYTAATGKGYPPYVSVNRLESGEVKISVRGPPKIINGIRICSHREGPGNCTPGGEHCNNYCNMAPEKGPMQDRALPCEQVFEGPYAEAVIPAEEWERIRS